MLGKKEKKEKVLTVLTVLKEKDELPKIPAWRIEARIRHFLSFNPETPQSDEELVTLWRDWNDNQEKTYSEDPITEYYGINIL